MERYLNDQSIIINYLSYRIPPKKILARSLLSDNESELNRRIAQLEIFGELRDVQHIILEEEQIIPIVYNLEKDIRYNQGNEKGIQQGQQQATAERNTAFVLHLL